MQNVTYIDFDLRLLALFLAEQEKASYIPEPTIYSKCCTSTLKENILWVELVGNGT
jgi:hypothetical protein